MITRLTLFLFGSLLAGTADAAADDKTDVVQMLIWRCIAPKPPDAEPIAISSRIWAPSPGPEGL
jgi:hypothetical protein